MQHLRDEKLMLCHRSPFRQSRHFDRQQSCVPQKWLPGIWMHLRSVRAVLLRGQRSSEDWIGKDVALLRQLREELETGNVGALGIRGD